MDWLSEYLTSVLGYITSDFGSTVINSLTFQATKERVDDSILQREGIFHFHPLGGRSLDVREVLVPIWNLLEST